MHATVSFPSLPPPRLAATPERAPGSDSLALLRAFPAVCAALERRGEPLGHGEGEDDEGLRNRLGTGLMALFRDERSEESFEALYAFARGAVLAWIQSLLPRGAGHLDPLEVLQDTFVNVYRYPSGFREEHPGSFRVWVRTIAGNLVRRAGFPRPSLAFQELPHGLQEPEDRRSDPAAEAQAVEQHQRLAEAWLLFLAHYERAWSQLSPRDRRTLQLVEVEGLSYQRAGSLLGVGRSNMKMIVFRARKRIAQAMRRSMRAGAPARAAALRSDAA